ncbi:MAG: MMPL family transporter [Bacteroidota bacterium]
MTRYRVPIIIAFAVLAIASGYFATQLKFSFDFEQFFPEGDEDLTFFRDFIDNFEADDNFMLVALVREEGVFDSTFLNKVHRLTLDSRKVPFVEESQSLTKFSYPLKTPFAVTSIPVIHRNDPSRYDVDKERVLADVRFRHNFINEDATTLMVYLRTSSSMSLQQSEEHMDALDELVKSFDFEEVHYMGRPYFQKELVHMQKREITVSAVVSAILVGFIMYVLFRRPWGIVLSLVSIGLGLLLFLGFLGAAQRELNAIAALYPVLMIIVGTSDVIHIMSKYIDELRKGASKEDAIWTSMKEIGMATLLTSLTTAIGFATLVTSRVIPIRDFGINAAIGVIIAYLTVIFFTTAALSFFDTDQIVKLGKGQAFWERLLERTYRFTRKRVQWIRWGSLALVVLCAWGISNITTNYNIISNMPRGERITEDFQFFERELSGFRPMEFAIFVQEGYRATDYPVLKEMAKLEDYLGQFSYIQAVGSVTAIYKSLNQMHSNNRVDAYRLPETEAEYRRFKRLADQVPNLQLNVLINEAQDKARITSRILDIGADTIKAFGVKTDAWMADNIDQEVIQVKRTGTGLIIDKNAEYIRRSLLLGLGIAVLIVSGLMALLFRNIRMLFISMVPNLIPLLLAGALLGYLGIDLEAGVSIVFAVIFGIAVDDSIHFLSKFKLARMKGMSVEDAIHLTFRETGKAIILTSIILFFGFLVMLFSIHPPSVTIGLLISLTLLSAVAADLLLLPLLIRWLIKDEPVAVAEKPVLEEV